MSSYPEACTVCPRSSGHFYIFNFLYKMGHYFLDRRYLKNVLICLIFNFKMCSCFYLINIVFSVRGPSQKFSFILPFFMFYLRKLPGPATKREGDKGLATKKNIYFAASLGEASVNMPYTLTHPVAIKEHMHVL